MNRMSRRAFIGRSTALAGAVALGSAVAPAGPLRRGHERKEGIPAAAGLTSSFELGLASYTFREFGLDEMIEMTARVGLRRVCLKDVHLPLDSPPGRIREVALKLREAGLVPYGCGVVYMRTEAEVRRAFEYAREAGMELIVGVPDHGLLGAQGSTR